MFDQNVANALYERLTEYEANYFVWRCASEDLAKQKSTDSIELRGRLQEEVNQYRRDREIACSHLFSFIEGLVHGAVAGATLSTIDQRASQR